MIKEPPVHVTNNCSKQVGLCDLCRSSVLLLLLILLIPLHPKLNNYLLFRPPLSDDGTRYTGNCMKSPKLPMRNMLSNLKVSAHPICIFFELIFRLWGQDFTFLCLTFYTFISFLVNKQTLCLHSVFLSLAQPCLLLAVFFFAFVDTLQHISVCRSVESCETIGRYV